jgi:hypothetical protein
MAEGERGWRPMCSPALRATTSRNSSTDSTCSQQSGFARSSRRSPCSANGSSSIGCATNCGLRAFPSQGASSHANDRYLPPGNFGLIGKETAMEYATLGNTGLLVSKLCFGTMTFGDDCASRPTTRAALGVCPPRGPLDRYCECDHRGRRDPSARRETGPVRS